MRKFAWLFITALIALSPAVFSQPQKITIKGKLTDDKNSPVADASVMVKNAGNGTTTDTKGNFQLTVSSLPVTLLISHISFLNEEIKVDNTNEVIISMKPVSGLQEEVLLVTKGIPTKIKDAPFSAEMIGHRRIRQLPTTSAYDAVVYLKGADQTSSSLTFKTPSTRGFNGSGSTRVNQLVDGMDNQAPGLNFFVGNFAGLTELDMESVELLPGASSALYGPGGMNGTVLINSKNPFKHPGLSVMIKPGIMHLGKGGRENASMYNDYSFRWAKKFNERVAFKLSAQYIQADDWLAGDTSNYLRSGTSGKLIPGTRATDPNYDGVNVYGDETSVNIHDVALLMETGGFLPPGASQLVPDLNASRTGYHERDIIDPKTKNIKLSGAFHYKLTHKIEAQIMGYWSTGNTVYTDDNRYALKGIKIGQYKLELKHKNWFFRTYTTQEDAGEAYSATVATQYFNEAWKLSQQWYPEYVGAFVTGAGQIFQSVLMNGGTLAQAQAAVVNAAPQLHAAGRAYADQGRPEAGSALFNQIFEQVRKTPIPNGGMFKEKSQLWMTEGQYTLGDAARNAEVIVGGNYKKYILNSSGTLFIDTLKPIGINEVGAYSQITKKLFQQALTLIASGRFDKNENFKAQFTPRFAALIRLAKDNNLRMSYQTAYRFPGNLAQWIRLDVGGDYLLLGGLPWVMDYMHADKNPVYQIGGPATPYEYKEFKPETMRSFEIGYKGVIKNKLLIDAYGYVGKYKDFIGRIGLYQPATGEAFSITVNSSNKVKTYGFGLGMDYRMNNNYSVFFNAYSDVITDVPSGFKAYFNAPKYRFNTGFGNSGLGKKELFSFNVMMRWQDAFEWEGELANGPLDAFATVDAQVSYKLSKIKSTLRLGGTNIFNHYYKNAYANPAIGGLYYAAYIYNF
ncbi:TonB-dependent receptor [Terrimonas pollutisoli]|uniref:TonB-dependent receptor n=1 Tax=Terrimonas pollutisoli TaxID=3034147 RepID=UPI0023EA9247|nr:TonB-dependent receptor [Terrimonas sp. H1YJ31]